MNCIHEDDWNIYYVDKEGNTQIEPKLVTGKFDERLFKSISIKDLDSANAYKAAISIYTARSINKNIPKEWIIFAENLCE